MAGTLDIIIANSPDQTVNVPYKPHEPIFFLLERVRAAIGICEDTLYHQDLFINGICLMDHQQTMAYYRIFGHTPTYRSLGRPP
ncbi:hypothetical protein BGX33_012347 [Mortierella sp. NVP41]|nr:hypothetical protein BGX33_012347 [Mortierella sp. NVP41]